MSGRLARVAFFTFLFWSNWLAIATCERHNGNSPCAVGLAGGAAITVPAEWLVQAFDTMIDGWLGMPFISSPLFIFPWFAAQILVVGFWAVAAPQRWWVKIAGICAALAGLAIVGVVLFRADVTDEETLLSEARDFVLQAILGGAMLATLRWRHRRQVAKGQLPTREWQFTLRAVMLWTTAVSLIAATTETLIVLGGESVDLFLIIAGLTVAVAVAWVEVAPTASRHLVVCTAVMMLAAWLVGAADWGDPSGPFPNEGRIDMILFVGPFLLYAFMALALCRICNALGILPKFAHELHPARMSGLVKKPVQPELMPTPGAEIAASCRA
jgi:hypothetical protein